MTHSSHSKCDFAFSLRAVAGWNESPFCHSATLEFAFSILVFVGSALFQSSLAEAQTVLADSGQQKMEFFENKIRPALIEHCLDCHAIDTEASGGLLLDSRDGWQAGGDSGSAILPGDSAKSLLIKVVDYSDPDLQMPPDGKLPDAVIQDLKQWIDDGATDPRRGQSKLQVQSGLPVERADEHWSYRPIDQSIHDTVANPGFIDELIEQTLDLEGYTPLATATELNLVRRLYFDLIGLPPTESEIREFQASTDKNKWNALVDQLLASPHFGERFARRWMDVARYADSITLRGFVLPEAWRYRDYLVDSYNSDRPFDQMIVEQVAGDLLPHKDLDLDERRNQLVATGFLALGNTNLERQDKTQLEMDYIDEQLEVIGRAFLGQTIGCARCHDHKFDPIPTKDYYALAGIFRSAIALDHDNVSKWIERELPIDGAEEIERERVKEEF